MAHGKSSSKNSAAITCEIPIKFLTLNGYVDICRRNRYQSAAYKKKIEYEIGYYLHGLPKLNNPVKIDFLWVEENRRRDLDNIAFAKKFILDALVSAGVLRNDSQKYVRGFSDSVQQGKENKVILTITEV